MACCQRRATQGKNCPGWILLIGVNLFGRAAEGVSMKWVVVLFCLTLAIWAGTEVTARAGNFSPSPCGEQKLPAACGRPIPAGASDPFVPVVSICAVRPDRLRVQSCVVSNKITVPTSGGLYLSVNFGIFSLDAAAPTGGRLLRMPGQSGPANIVTVPDPSPPRLIAYTAAETTEPIAPDEMSQLTDQSLAQVTWGICDTVGPKGCDNPPSPQTSSFLLPITAPANSP
jgi:hypothetical protein